MIERPACSFAVFVLWENGQSFGGGRLAGAMGNHCAVDIRYAPDVTDFPVVANPQICSQFRVLCVRCRFIFASYTISNRQSASHRSPKGHCV